MACSINHQPHLSKSLIYLTPAFVSLKVLSKVASVLLHSKSKRTETFDDGAQRNMILTAAAQRLQLESECETLALCVVEFYIIYIIGSKVIFQISPKATPQKCYRVQRASTAKGLDLME